MKTAHPYSPHLIVTWQRWPLGWLMQRFGLQWSHVLVAVDLGGGYLWAWEATGKGVHDHVLRWEHLGERHKAFVPREEISLFRLGRFTGYADGSVGKPYGLWLWPVMAMRIVKDFCQGFVSGGARAAAQGVGRKRETPKVFFVGGVTQGLRVFSQVCSTLADDCFKAMWLYLAPGIEDPTPDDLAASQLLREVKLSDGS